MSERHETAVGERFHARGEELLATQKRVVDQQDKMLALMARQTEALEKIAAAIAGHAKAVTDDQGCPVCHAPAGAGHAPMPGTGAICPRAAGPAAGENGFSRRGWVIAVKGFDGEFEFRCVTTPWTSDRRLAVVYDGAAAAETAAIGMFHDRYPAQMMHVVPTSHPAFSE